MLKRSHFSSISTGSGSSQSDIGLFDQCLTVVKKKWWIFALVFGTTAFSILITRWRYKSRIRRMQRRRGSILVEPPSDESSLNGVTSHANSSFAQLNSGRLHASHSAPSLINHPQNGIWDVVIVGGGPAGATAAYYLSKEQLNVLVLEKDCFPRDKICGDQIQPQVQFILSDMGILQSLVDDDAVKWTTNRGIVSPSGISFIGELKEKESLVSVQRIVLDKKLIDAATREGAILRENTTVKSARLVRGGAQKKKSNLFLKKSRKSSSISKTQSHPSDDSHHHQTKSEEIDDEDDDYEEEEDDESLNDLGDHWIIQVVPTPNTYSHSHHQHQHQHQHHHQHHHYRSQHTHHGPNNKNNLFSESSKYAASSVTVTTEIHSDSSSSTTTPSILSSPLIPSTHKPGNKEDEVGQSSSTSTASLPPENRIIYAKILICADGANSYTARNLTGLTPEESPSPSLGPPNAIGCRSFAKPKTHLCRADEVSFYSKEVLPGSFRISAELEDYLNLSCFVLPSDDYTTSQLPLHAVHQFNRAIEEPWIRATLGNNCVMTPLNTAPMRVGGVHKTFFPQGLMVGDAAGQQDPLSGDGLQYGMRAAKMAADVVTLAFREGRFGTSSMQRYEKLWKYSFGWDFFWARQIVFLISKFPILVDAVALVIQRHGMKAISFWALAKSGMKSKWELILWFLRPDVAWLMVYYSLNLWLRKHGYI